MRMGLEVLLLTSLLFGAPVSAQGEFKFPKLPKIVQKQAFDLPKDVDEKAKASINAGLRKYGIEAMPYCPSVLGNNGILYRVNIKKSRSKVNMKKDERITPVYLRENTGDEDKAYWFTIKTDVYGHSIISMKRDSVSKW